MAPTIALLLYAGLAGTLGSAALRRARWTARAPRIGVAIWQALSASIVVAVVLTGVGFWMPEQGWNGLASLVHVCEAALGGTLVGTADALVHLAGLVGSIVVVVRLAAALSSELRRARRHRRSHLAMLRLAATPDGSLGALIVDHPAAAAYCLPGRAGHVILTSAAIALLDDDELTAVMAHERSHLRRRHHIVLGAAHAMARAVPWLPGMRTAHQEQVRLVEMVADDAAARSSTPQAVASAVLRLAEGAGPPPALAAAETAAAQRVERMLADLSPLGTVTRALACATVALVAAAPLLVAAAPALTAGHLDYCLVAGLAA
jgi:Zn-dependent protease with chaperone function